MVLLSFQYLWLAKPSLEWYTYNSSRWVARASQTFSKQYRCSGWIETLFQVPLIALLLELRSVFTFPFWFGHAVVNPGESLFLLTTLLAPLKKRSFDKLFRLLFFPLYLLTEEERMLLPLLWFMACLGEQQRQGNYLLFLSKQPFHSSQSRVSLLHGVPKSFQGWFNYKSSLDLRFQ